MFAPFTRLQSSQYIFLSLTDCLSQPEQKELHPGVRMPPPAPSLTRKLHFISQSIQECKIRYCQLNLMFLFVFFKSKFLQEQLQKWARIAQFQHFFVAQPLRLILLLMKMSANVEIYTRLSLNWLLMKSNDVSYLVLHERCCNTAACWCGRCTYAVA